MRALLAVLGLVVAQAASGAADAGVPNTTTGFSPQTFMCTADAPENPAPDSAMACIISAASAMPSPAPP